MSSRVEQKRAAKAERLAHEHERELADRRRKRLLWFGGGFLALIAVVAIVALAAGGGGEDKKKGSAPEGAGEVASLYRGIPQDGTQLGSPRAPITLTEYADLQCPFCADYARNALPTIVKRYVRTGKVRLDFRVLTFLGPDSESGAQVALAAAEQNHMWQFNDLFYRNQGPENSGYATDSFLKELAGAVPGLNVNRAFRQRESGSVATAIENHREQAERFGIDSTPSFQIARRGGQPRPFEVQALEPDAFTEQLDRELAGR